MAYSPLTPTIYIGAADSYFADTRPDEMMGLVQWIRLTEGVDASRPFQRFRQSRLAFETVFVGADAQSRPYQAGQLVWLQVGVGSAAATTWFRGLLLDPDYDSSRSGKVTVRMSALDVSDVLNEEITVANQSSETIAHNFGLLLDGVGWPDNADWRDIDADLIEQLSSWEHSGKAISSAQQLTDTVGPPARMVIRRNGGIRVIKDVADVPEYFFTDQDVIGQAKVKQHEDSVINTVTIEGTTLGSVSSTVRNRRPLDYDVLDGLAATERVNVIRRILRAYENGLTSLAFEVDADDDRNQADVAALLPGKVIELQSEQLNATHQGPVSGLRWRWERTRAFVRANIVVQPPEPDVFGVRLYFVTTFLDNLLFIDVETGISTTIPSGDPGASALAYDPNNDILYGGGGRFVYNINTTTGVGTQIGAGAFPTLFSFDYRAMAYDSSNDVLYAAAVFRQFSGDDASVGLYTINTADGTLTQLPFPSVDIRFRRNGISGLAFNSRADVLYATEGSRLATLNVPDLSVVSDINLVGIVSLFSLAYDDNNLTLYGVLNGPGRLITIDPVGGTYERIGTTDDFGLPDAIEFNTGLAYMSLGRVLAMPSGLALTESGGDITASWDVVTDATGYVLEWREEGSGGAWQTVDVSAPPHTFTP